LTWFSAEALASEDLLPSGHNEPHSLQDISFSIEHDDCEALSIGGTPTVLQTGGSKSFTIRFAPHTLGPFQARIPIEVNGLFTLHVELRATVCKRAVELMDRSLAPLALGTLRVGKTRRHKVELLNAAPIPVLLDFSPAAGLAEGYDIHVDTQTMQLSARQHRPLSITFRPKKRLLPFTVDLYALVAGVQQRVLTLSGSAQGLNVRLGAQALPFGTVVLGSHATKHLQLINSGMHIDI
jgi:hydrocephalus-inducing protein